MTARAPAATGRVDLVGDAFDGAALTIGPSWVSSSVPAPTPQRAHRSAEPLGELLGDRLLHEEPVRGGAGLPAVAHLGHHRALDRGVEIGVVEDEERLVAAELHRDVDDRGRRPAPSSSRPTPVEPVNDSLRTRVVGERGLDQLARACRWSARSRRRRGAPASPSSCGEQQRGQRRLLGRLEHDRAAGREGRADLAGGHRGREVPRRQQQRRRRPACGRSGCGSPRTAPSAARRRPAPPPRRTSGRTRRRRSTSPRASVSDLPISSDMRKRELLLALGHQLERPAQHLGALARRGRGPPRLRGRRRVDRGQRVLGGGRDAASTSPVDGSRTSKRPPEPRATCRRRTGRWAPC